MTSYICELESRFPSVAFRVIAGFPNYIVGDNGTVWSTAYGTARRLSEDKSAQGYSRVELRNGNKVEKKSVAALVLEAFIGPRPCLPIKHHSCHNDGNINNNSLSNLRWDTPAGNCADKILHGTAQQGERHPRAKLSDADVYGVLQRVMSGELATRIARELGVCHNVIEQIVNRTLWKNVVAPDGYDEWRASWHGSSGERSGKNKLSAEQVKQIRLRRSESKEALAAEFGVTKFTIRDIWRRRSWRSVQ